ncbi:MAG: glycosyltransferase family 4 protein [Bacteroidales bacterium]|nr:glycosyltransferase family 4 protein [Bacteroidales bacterium]
MGIIMVGGIFPPQIYQDIVYNSVGCVQYAADALQKAIIYGLAANKMDFTLVNAPFVGSYPKRYKVPYIESFSFNYETLYATVNAKNVGFCNLSVIKLVSRYHTMKRELIKHIKSSGDKGNTLLIYSVHSPFLKACVEVKKRFPSTRIALIVPDLPEYMSDDKSLVRKLASYVNESLLDRLYKYVDGYVLLSKYMCDRLPVGKKPWTVVEGVYDSVNEIEPLQHKTCVRYILYTGTLAARYGIQTLVKAFAGISDPSVRLYICGEGDSRPMIEEWTCKDSRIIYKGQVTREEALMLQKNATLLVNPRTPEGDFTKYSFPSKNMEYLASGVPTLLYRLPGIPEEYYEYCFNLSETGVEALRDMLEDVIARSEEELEQMGRKARQFILNDKNPQKQVKKIIDLISVIHES